MRREGLYEYIISFVGGLQCLKEEPKGIFQALALSVTHRPRSVSSLLIRLRAMTVVLCWWSYVMVRCVVGKREWRLRGSRSENVSRVLEVDAVRSRG